MLLLADGGEGAEHHRQDRDERDHLLPFVGDRGEGTDHGADEQRHRRHLGRRGEEGGDRCRRALVDVRRPHVERHGGNLEGEAGDEEDKAEDEADRRTALERHGNAGERGLAGEAVDQRGTVEQHAGGQSTEDEVLEAGLGRAHRIPVDRGDHVKRQRLQLEADIDRDQVVGRDHHHHAERGDDDEHRILEALELLQRGRSPTT